MLAVVPKLYLTDSILKVLYEVNYPEKITLYEGQKC